jgi:antitoxin component HigA of HigAB toxin-antitoxin module
MAWSVYPFPSRAAALANDREYADALDELEDLFLAEADTPQAHRFDELVHLIEQYEARQHLYLLGTRKRRDATLGTRG